MQAPDSNRGAEPSVCASPIAVPNRPIPTILLVEDEAFVREVACEILRVAGYRVLPARNAAEAVPAFLAHREEVQLLLTDVVLPDRNGRDLAFELATLGHAFRIIFISGLSGEFGYQKRISEARMVLSSQTILRRIPAAKSQ